MKTIRRQIILGIETSCDETAAAVIKVQSPRQFGGQAPSKVQSFGILSDVVSSQVKIHQKYGGVVPEVAARNHIKNILPVIDEALREAKVKPKDIDKIAVTFGPGLITSLMVGVETAKTLAYVWDKPLVAVNHLKAHVYAAMLDEKQESRSKNQGFEFPVMALIVSGGHTELVLMKNIKSFRKIGQTLDDAAGEAFDKVAKILGLGYPGGPLISKAAESGNWKAFDLPRPMIKSKDFNFSFAGLKTAVLYKNQELGIRNQEYVSDMSASFQQAVVEVLVEKTVRAALRYGAKTVILSGGVAANNLLRETLGERVEKLGLQFVVPERKFCTDNAVMVAVAGCFGKEINWRKVKVDPNLEISG
jgi:N6-L-threonylcarbamoyladenine synthase